MSAFDPDTLIFISNDLTVLLTFNPCLLLNKLFFINHRGFADRSFGSVAVHASKVSEEVRCIKHSRPAAVTTTFVRPRLNCD